MSHFHILENSSPRRYTFNNQRLAGSCAVSAPRGLQRSPQASARGV